MSEQDRTHPYSGRIERMTGAVVAFTPCCGARVFFPSDEAVPGKPLHAICPRDGRGWRLDLVADDQVEGGLGPVWAAPRKGAEHDR